MRSLRSCLFCLVAGLLLSGCSSTDTTLSDIRVNTEANPKVNLSGYKTYAWAAAAAAVREGERRWTPPNLDIGAEITFLVDRELRARGMTQASQNPDVLLIYGVGVDMTALQSVDTEAEGAEQIKNVPQGGILVILVDADTYQPVWAGNLTANINEEPSAELTKKRLDYGITQMFKRFPG